jgi:hypothetical protein
MATEKKEYIFKGTVKWLTNFQSKEYGNYNFLFFPTDAATRKAVKDTGIRNGVKEDDDGFYYTFRSDEPFVVLDAEGKVYSGKIGNGSTVDLRLVVEKFDTAKYGRVARGTIESVVITKLVEYNPEPKVEAKTEVPA